jgi:hypothetical protein
MRVRTEPECDVSVLVPVGDDEDYIGLAVRRTVAHLRALGLRFEVLALDEGSRDNSLAVLALLRRELPQLTVMSGAGPDEGVARGAVRACGRTLLVVDPRRDVALGALAWALGRIAAGRDAVVLEGRYLVARRLTTFSLLSQLRGRGSDLERAFLRRAPAARLSVELPPRRPRGRWQAFTDRLLRAS